VVIKKEPPKVTQPVKPKIKPTPKATVAEQPVVNVPDPRPVDTYVEPAPPSQAPTAAVASPGPEANPNRDLTLSARVAPTPPYPPKAAREGAQGEVILRLTIDANGNVIDVKIEKTSRNRDLDRGAQSWVKARWKFHPTGKTEVGRLPIVFRLD
jgi:protein TonB